MSVRVGTCLEVSHMQPQLSAILTVRVTACQVNLCVSFDLEVRNNNTPI